MIDSCALPSWETIFTREGLKALRRGRGQCPLCESKTAFSCHDEKGFNCFACGEHGDKLTFIQQFHNCDFKDALRFFGMEPGRPPQPDLEILRRHRIRQGLRTWAEHLGRQLRDEHWRRFRIEAYGLEKLHCDSEDNLGWRLLQISYFGLGQLEELLDRVDIGRDEERIATFRELRRAA